MINESRNVIISITGTQSTGPEQDSMEVITEAKLTRDGDLTVIDYAEPSENGLEDTATHIRAEGSDTVTITRTGKYHSQLILEKGRRHLNHYDMGFTQILMGVNASLITNTLDRPDGLLQVNYTLEMNHSLISNNRFLLKIVEVKNDNEKSPKACI